MRLDTMALMRLTLTLFQSAGTNPILPPHAHNCFARPVGWLCVRCSEPMDITRVDLKPKRKKIDLDGALSVLVSAVVCVCW